MNAEFVDAHCAALRGAHQDTPFGPEIKVWKVGGKMFAAYAYDGSGVSLKCRDAQTAAILLGQGKATQPTYLREDGWVMLPWSTPRAELAQRLSTSHETVMSRLTTTERLRVNHI